MLRKWSRILRSGIALGTILALALNFSSHSAHALIHKQGLRQDRSRPELLLKNWGLENSQAASHINARKAWRISRGTKKVVVAVIDTGVDPSHPDLRDSICGRSGAYGYDFVSNRKNPTDPHGHGTHVAGIIAAQGSTGAMGIAPQVCIMAIRYYSEKASGTQNLANTVKAIDYAVRHGAKVINYSGGGAEFSAAEMAAIQRAEAKGVVFVAAAGNEYQDTDQSGNAYYPAAYGLSNIISVTATNIKNQILPSSNWGRRHVHVAAPGENIYSTLPRKKYGYLTGTSQATAYVSGLAALILSEMPSLKPYEVRDIIMRSSDKLEGLKEKTMSGGRINAYAALRMTIARREGRNSRILALLDREDRQGAKAPTRSKGALAAREESSEVRKTIQAIRARGVAVR